MKSPGSPRTLLAPNDDHGEVLDGCSQGEVLIVGNAQLIGPQDQPLGIKRAYREAMSL